MEENQKPTDSSIYKDINVNNVLNLLDAKYPHTVGKTSKERLHMPPARYDSGLRRVLSPTGVHSSEDGPVQEAPIQHDHL